MAPFMPFVSEYVYQHLVCVIDKKAPPSVHFCDYPVVDSARIDPKLEERMAIVRSVVGLGRKLRDDLKIKVRQPLAKLIVASRDPAVTEAARATAALISDELNVKVVETSADESAFCTFNIKPNFQTLRERAEAREDRGSPEIVGGGRNCRTRERRDANCGRRAHLPRRHSPDAHPGRG
jgi:isoleucyl-tRNA synthetase